MAEKEKEELFDQDLSIFEELADVLNIEEEDEEIVDDSTKQNAGSGEDITDEPIEDEEEDEDPEINEDDDDEEGDESSEENSSLFKPYAKFLVENDVLSTLDLEKYDGTIEGLLEAQKAELDYRVSKYKETLPPEIQKLVNGYEAGVPFDEMLKISSDRIRYDNISTSALEDNIDLQKNVIAEYMKKTTKFSDTKINKHIERLENNAELEDEAKSSLGELKQIQDYEEQEAIKRNKAEQEEAEKYQAKLLSQLKEKITSTSEIIPGVKVGKLMKEKIERNLTTPVAFDEHNNPVNKVGLYSRNNPIEFEVILNYIFEATNEFKDWSIFSKGGKSKAISELEEAARTLDKSKGVSRANRNKKSSNTDLYKAMAEMLK